MKKLYIICYFLFSFIHINIFCYQPQEFGLLFGKIGPTENTQEIKRNISIVRQLRADGTFSNVFEINDVAQFLYLAIKPQKPLVIYLHANDNINRTFYQDLADNFSDKIMFVSVNIFSNINLVKLFEAFLKFERLVPFNVGLQFPIIVFCESGAISLNNRSLALRKNSLKLLSKPGNLDKDSIKDLLDKKLELNSIVGVSCTKNSSKLSDDSINNMDNTKGTFVGPVKNWINLNSLKNIKK